MFESEKVKHVFCVPGESYLALIDAFYDTDIQLISARYESGAVFMAEAYAKATGKPGVAIATRAGRCLIKTGETAFDFG